MSDEETPGLIWIGPPLEVETFDAEYFEEARKWAAIESRRQILAERARAKARARRERAERPGRRAWLMRKIRGGSDV